MSNNKQFSRRSFLGLSAAACGSLFLAGCGQDEDAKTNESKGADTQDKGTIKIGWHTWDEAIAVTALWRRILEDNGYTVELTQADAGPLYQALDNKDIDLYLDSWLPITHGDYMDQYQDSIEELGTWNENAVLTWAVPTYIDDITTFEDLAGQGDRFNNQIIGIEPGAGLTRLSKQAIPHYGLDSEFELIEGSTSAMLAELQRAIQKEEPIVVTLWRPHWAYSEHELLDLKDTDKILGEAEVMKSVAREGFSEEMPEVAEWLNNFKLTDQQITDLGHLVVNEFGTGRESDAIDEWLQDPENQALVDEWTGQ